jgi:hypothetical protein
VVMAVVPAREPIVKLASFGWRERIQERDVGLVSLVKWTSSSA